MTTHDPKTMQAKTEKGSDAAKQEAERVYAEINQEVALLMGDKDKIVFGPVEDFEYKAPLEDFQESRQKIAS